MEITRKHREALTRLVDREHAAAARCADRGQWGAHASHLIKAGRFLSAMDAA